MTLRPLALAAALACTTAADDAAIGPSAVVVAPPSGTEVPLDVDGATVELLGIATDPTDPDCCDLAWSSDLDGFLGRGAQVTATLQTLGHHVVTLTATNADGLDDTSDVDLEVVHGPPTLEILAPSAGLVPYRGERVSFEGAAVDPSGTTLPDVAYVWSSSDFDDPFPLRGPSVAARFPTAGSRTLTLTVTGASGQLSAADVAIDVRVADADDPLVSVHQPLPNTVLDPDAWQALSATMTIRGDQDGILVRVAHGWSLDYAGETYRLTSDLSGLSNGFVPASWLPEGECGLQAAVLVAWGSDNWGSAYVQIPVLIDWPAC